MAGADFTREREKAMSTRLLEVFHGIRQSEPVNAFTADVLAEAIRRGELFCVYEAGPDSLERLAALQRGQHCPQEDAQETPTGQERADIPTLEVVARGRFRTPSGALGCHLVFRCPQCGKENCHGGAYGQLGAGDGHRVSHCACWPKGYYLREVPRPTRERTRPRRRQTVGHGQTER